MKMIEPIIGACYKQDGFDYHLFIVDIITVWHGEKLIEPKIIMRYVDADKKDFPTDKYNLSKMVYFNRWLQCTNIEIVNRLNYSGPTYSEMSDIVISETIQGKTASKQSKNKHGTCCYCEISLDAINYSREHVIPRHAGGRIIKPCCKGCNQEKGGMTLKNYISVLNTRLLFLKPDQPEYKINQIKIKNANLLAIEIDQQQLF